MARRVTLKDIAERLDVSTAVVSTVLSNRSNNIFVSEATRQSVLETAQQLGYKPRGRTRVLSEDAAHMLNVAILCLPWYSPLFGQTVSELCRSLGRWGFHPFIHVTADRAAARKAVLDLRQQGRAEAFILLGSRRNPEEVEIGDVPCVVIGEVPPSADVWQVCVDNVHGGGLAGEHLWHLGHRRVGIVAFPDAPFSAKEIAGFRAVWEDHGQRVPEHRILTVTHERYLAEELPAFLRRTAAQEGAPLTALFCTGDVLAASTVRILKGHGWRVPDDLSVVGFDDSPLLAECLDPPLTTVRQPFVQLGHLAAQLLQERIEQPKVPPRRLFLPGDLIVRQSTAPVREAVS